MRLVMIVAGVVGLLTAAGVVLSRSTQAAEPTSQPAVERKLGVNLEGLSDFMAADMLIDLTRTARAFGKKDAAYQNESGVIKTDSQGWPLEDAGIVLRTGAASDWAERLSYTFMGQAQLSVFPPHAVRVEQHRYDPASNLSSGTLRVSPDADTLFMYFRQTTGGIRHLQVMRVEPAVGPFTKRFLDQLEPFRGQVLRFMDLQATNNSNQKSWADRATLSDWRYGDKGLPLEHMIELANLLSADAWFCMPHQADAEYIEQFARMVKQRLDPGLKVYVEHSNEVWNSQFQQAGYVEKAGLSARLSDNPFQARLLQHGERTAKIGRIWREAFGDQPSRLVVVLGAQAANSWTAEAAIEKPAVAELVDALAIAPYFGHSYGDPATADRVARMSPSQLLDETQTNDLGKMLPEWLGGYRKLARKLGKRLIAYEAGQHYAGHGGSENNEKLAELFMAANRHERMGSLYRDYLALWFAGDGPARGDVMCLFSFTGRPSKWGSWGLLEDLNQPASRAPKWSAVVDTLEALRGPLP